MPWCPNCADEYLEGVMICSDCGSELVAEEPEIVHVMRTRLKEVRAMGWCWGGFQFTFIWAFANKAWLIAVGCLMPGIWILLSFYLGFRGHEVAWRKRRFESFEQYKETMKVWDKWGLWWFILNMTLLALWVIAMLTGPDWLTDILIGML